MLLPGLNQQSTHTTKLTWMFLLLLWLPWINTKIGDKVTVELETTASKFETDPYACAIRIKNKYFSNLITVGHIPLEISRLFHFFIKTGGRNVNGYVKSLTYRPSPTPFGGLEIPLQLTFSCGQKGSLDIMNAFVNRLYDWNDTGIVNVEENEENDEENTDDEHLVRTSSNSNECDDVIVLD